MLSGRRKVKRQRSSSSRKRNSRNLISAAAQGAGLDFDGYSSSDSIGTMAKKRQQASAGMYIFLLIVFFYNKNNLELRRNYARILSNNSWSFTTGYN